MNLSFYDFIDFEAGTGGSISYSQNRFGGIGMGLELNQKKVQQARENGFAVFQSNILDLPGEKNVRYVSMMDFLEHLPDLETVEKMIGIACSSAKEFVFINHPVFDDEQYLRSLGYKLYFHDWSGHTVHPSLGFLLGYLSKFGAFSIDVKFRKSFTNAEHDAVLPADSPRDSHRYDSQLHGTENEYTFHGTLYEQVQIIARLK